MIKKKQKKEKEIFDKLQANITNSSPNTKLDVHELKSKVEINKVKKLEDLDVVMKYIEVNDSSNQNAGIKYIIDELEGYRTKYKTLNTYTSIKEIDFENVKKQQEEFKTKSRDICNNLLYIVNFLLQISNEINAETPDTKTDNKPKIPKPGIQPNKMPFLADITRTRGTTNKSNQGQGGGHLLAEIPENRFDSTSIDICDMFHVKNNVLKLLYGNEFDNDDHVNEFRNNFNQLQEDTKTLIKIKKLIDNLKTKYDDDIKEMNKWIDDSSSDCKNIGDNNNINFSWNINKINETLTLFKLTEEENKTPTQGEENTEKAKIAAKIAYIKETIDNNILILCNKITEVKDSLSTIQETYELIDKILKNLKDYFGTTPEKNILKCIVDMKPK